MSQQKVELVREGYSRWQAGDYDLLPDFFLTNAARDIDLYSRFGGFSRAPYRGQDGLRAWLAEIQENFVHFEPLFDPLWKPISVPTRLLTVPRLRVRLSRRADARKEARGATRAQGARPIPIRAASAARARRRRRGPVRQTVRARGDDVGDAVPTPSSSLASRLARWSTDGRRALPCRHVSGRDRPGCPRSVAQSRLQVLRMVASHPFEVARLASPPGAPARLLGTRPRFPRDQDPAPKHRVAACGSQPPWCVAFIHVRLAEP
jgi:hypothetical protein